MAQRSLVGFSMFSLERGAHGRASVRSPQGDGIPMLLFRWKVRVRKIQCSSARMAREGTFPACARIRVSAFWIFSLLCPYSIETWKNPVGCPFEREARSEKCSRDFSPCSVRCGALQPYRVRDPEQSGPGHRLKPEITASSRGGVESNGRNQIDRNESEHDSA